MRRICRPVRPVLAAALLLVLTASCDTADKYKKETPEPTVEQGGDTRELRVEGTPDEMRFAQAMAGGLDAAYARYDVGDTLEAIATVDSLLRTAEAVVDTLPVTNSLNDFLLIYITDTYGVLREWHGRRNDHEALSDLGHRYNDLAARLQEKRDSVNTETTKTTEKTAQ